MGESEGRYTQLIGNIMRMVVPSCQIKIGKYDAFNIRALYRNAKG